MKETLPTALSIRAKEERKRNEHLQSVLSRYQKPLLEKLGDTFKDQRDPNAPIRVDGIPLREIDFNLLEQITGLLAELEEEHLGSEEDRPLILKHRTEKMIDAAVSRYKLTAKDVIKPDGALAFPPDQEISFDVVPNAQHLSLLCPDLPPKHWQEHSVFLHYGHVHVYPKMTQNAAYVKFHIEPAALCGLPLGQKEQELLKKYLRHELPAGD